jgi:hypothetical protein
MWGVLFLMALFYGVAWERTISPAMHAWLLRDRREKISEDLT